MTQRQDIAMTVATNLKTLEHSLDQSARLTAQFAADLVAARGDANLGLNVGASALTKVANSLVTLARAREELADAHHDLAVVGRAIGARTGMVMGGDKLIAAAPARPQVVEARDAA